MPELAPVTMAIFPLSDWAMRRSLLIDDRRRQSKLKAFSVSAFGFSVQLMKEASQATIRRPLAGRAGNWGQVKYHGPIVQHWNHRRFQTNWRRISQEWCHW